MGRLLPLLAIALLALAGCSKRERSNPFDPRNPITRGGPSGFAALAGNGRAELRWDLITNPGFEGYRVYRKAAGEDTFRVISTVLPTSSTHYGDFGLLNGLDHTYRLYFVFEDGERGHPAEDIATPGPARPWIANASAGQIHLVTPDARHVGLSVSDLGLPSRVAVDSVLGVVWVSDASGTVVVYDPATGIKTVIPGFVAPSGLAVDPLSGSAWICDEGSSAPGSGALHHLTTNGTPLGNPIQPLTTPLGVAIDPWDRSVWVAERGGNRVLHYSESQFLIAATTIDRPSRVAVDSLTREVWIASFTTGKVFRLAPTGAVEDSVRLSGPIGIAVDARRGTIWVADALGNRLVALDRSGSIQFQIPDLIEVRDVSVDVESGEAWAVAPGSGEVLRVSAAGVVLRRLGGFQSPQAVSVDPGAR